MEGNQVPQDLVVKVGEEFEHILKEASSFSLIVYHMNDIVYPLRNAFCGSQVVLVIYFVWFLISRLIKYGRNALRTYL